MQLLPISLVLQLPPLMQAIYLLICIGIGILGRKKVMGFWGMFFSSIILSPVIGILIVAVSKRKE